MSVGFYRCLAGSRQKIADLLAMDSLIAATALVHGMNLVTRKVAYFQASGVLLLNFCETQ
jgi:predicted nucleic acid-binding protein